MGKGGGGGGAPSPDPNIGIAQRELAELSRETLQHWKTHVWPEIQRQTAVQENRANEQFELSRRTQDFQNQIAREQYDRYLNKFKPLQDKVVQEADQYDTEANRQRLATEAAGDVNAAFDVQRQADLRRAQAYGINPASGSFTGGNNATSALQAATAASAATRARFGAEQLGWAKKLDAIGLGSGVFGNQATSTGLALNAGSQGLNAGQIGISNTLAGGQSANQAYGQAMGGWNQVGQLGVQKYNADVNAWSANRQANATESAGWGQAVGTLAGIGAKAYFSDIRTKENIQLVGWDWNGLPVYEFEYRPEFKDCEYAGHGVHRGYMAHEVEKFYPEAVFEDDNGFKIIDYSKVN